MKTRPLYLSALLLLAACGGDDTAKQPSPDRLEKELVDALRRCDLISAGTLHSFPFVVDSAHADVASCQAECLHDFMASCDELTTFACGSHLPDKLQHCFAECEKTDLSCADGKGSFRANQQCDATADCEDRSDEKGCLLFTGLCDDGQKYEGFSPSLCDGVESCADGSDEQDCPAPRYCKNGDLIALDELCNGREFCADGEDEQRCPIDDGFECKDGSGRVLPEQVCDLQHNCADGSDEEQGCAKLTCEDAPSCADSLPDSKKCDGMIDCDDVSDEQGCVNLGFDCGNGTQLPASARCDGVAQCENGADELDCPSNGTFTCADGTLITATYHCDNFTDCPDGSDELNCSTAELDGGFKCNDGTDIWDSSKCDNFDDCAGGEDELGCPVDPSKFDCNDGSFIDVSQVCDGTLNCLFGDDEANCQVPPPPGDGGFVCNDGTDIMDSLVCNQLSDCSGGEDEASCEPPATFMCTDGSVIDLTKKCDGANDCADMSDEAGCTP